MSHLFDVTKILAPTDLNPLSVPALRYAGLFAEKFKAKLTVFYCDPVIYPLDGIAATPFASAPADLDARLRADADRYATNVLGTQPYELRLTVGQPIPSILQAADEQHADLIVVGTHAHHGWQRVLLGSISDGVLYGAACPVLTVAAGNGAAREPVEGIRRILCPVNFSEVALDALRAARRLAQTFGADLLVVHVVEPSEIADPAVERSRVRRWISPELDGICMYRDLVVRGSAAERVLDCAEDSDADLIVVGAQHKFFRNATVIGTTADRLIRFASCPVFVVPREAAIEMTRQKEEEAAAVL